MQKASYAAVAVFIVLVVISFSYLFILSTQITSSNTTQGSLKTSISSLESTEQRVVLMKDRISKINALTKEEDTQELIGAFESITKQVPITAVLIAGEVTDEASKISYLMPSSSSLVELMAVVSANEDYEIVLLKAFSYTPSSGYLVNFEMK